jgi:hypothetical protein
MEIIKRAITFGVQYGRDPERHVIHPLGMTADGYAVIEAPDVETVRKIAFAIFGEQWSNDYSLDKFLADPRTAQWHPEGELLRIAWVEPRRSTTPEEFERQMQNVSQIRALAKKYGVEPNEVI